MGNLSRLSAKCRACPFSTKCSHKKIEALGYLDPAARDISQPIMQDIAVKHNYRDVKVAENTTITIDIEELKRQMEQELCKSVGLGLNFGA